jgi:hypothetical protein
MHARLGAARPLETEARDGSHRRLCGGQELLKPTLVQHRRRQIRSQRLFADWFRPHGGYFVCPFNTFNT